MGVAMGLHRDLPASTPMDLGMREHRRRSWWAVYSMNRSVNVIGVLEPVVLLTESLRIISCKNGYPLGVDDHDISVSRPLPSVS